MNLSRKKNQNFDASSIRPCYAELKQHLFRSIYTASIWRSLLQPEDYGWIQVDKYQNLYYVNMVSESPYRRIEFRSYCLHFHIYIALIFEMFQ